MVEIRGKTCQQYTNRKSGSGFRIKIFSPLGVASIAVESNFRELLENGKV
jgi:hypothetical protein